MKSIEHLADFLGAEKRRRWDEFKTTRHMRCWDCINVIDELAKVYDLHWDKEKEMSLPCPTWPEKCSTADKCAAILEAHQCPFDTKKNRKKCCATEGIDPPRMRTDYHKHEGKMESIPPKLKEGIESLKTDPGEDFDELVKNLRNGGT